MSSLQLSDAQEIGGERKTGVRPISRGYLVSFSLALVGIVMIAIAWGSELEARAGRSPGGAIDRYGVPAFIFIWFLLYLFRFIFWRRIAEPRQNQVRIVVTGILIVEVLVAIAAAVVILAAPAPAPAPAPARSFSISGYALFLAVLCQISTVTWLVRYRRE